MSRLLAVPSMTGTGAVRDPLYQPGRRAVLHFATHSGQDFSGPWLALGDGRLGGTEAVVTVYLAVFEWV